MQSQPQWTVKPKLTRRPLAELQISRQTRSYEKTLVHHHCLSWIKSQNRQRRFTSTQSTHLASHQELLWQIQGHHFPSGRQGCSQHDHGPIFDGAPQRETGLSTTLFRRIGLSQRQSGRLLHKGSSAHVTQAEKQDVVPISWSFIFKNRSTLASRN